MRSLGLIDRPLTDDDAMLSFGAHRDSALRAVPMQGYNARVLTSQFEIVFIEVRTG